MQKLELRFFIKVIQLLMYYCLSIDGYDLFVTIEFVSCMDLLLEDGMQWLLGLLQAVYRWTLFYI